MPGRCPNCTSRSPDCAAQVISAVTAYVLSGMFDTPGRKLGRKAANIGFARSSFSATTLELLRYATKWVAKSKKDASRKGPGLLRQPLLDEPLEIITVVLTVLAHFTNNRFDLRPHPLDLITLKIERLRRQDTLFDHVCDPVIGDSKASDVRLLSRSNRQGKRRAGFLQHPSTKAANFIRTDLVEKNSYRGQLPCPRCVFCLLLCIDQSACCKHQEEDLRGCAPFDPASGNPTAPVH